MSTTTWIGSDRTITDVSQLGTMSDADHVLVPWVSGSTPRGPLVVKSEGSYFWDDAGRQYLDFGSQLVFTNLGHGERRVIDAISRQADELVVAAHLFETHPRLAAARLLSDITPGDLSRTFFSTGGGEANEAALKMAKDLTGRPLVCSRSPSYHGSTYGAMSLSDDLPAFHFAPAVPGIIHVPVCHPYRCHRAPAGERCNDCGEHCADELEATLLQYGPDRVAAVVLEPVIGSSSGVVIPGDGYMQRVREICTKYGILMVADEVMTGFGRTGRWFACDHWDVVPDIMTMAKGLSGGYIPMGATIIRGSLAESWDQRNFWHGHTYSGHTLGCAAIAASIQVYAADGLVARSAELGNYLLAALEDLPARHPSIGDVRGIGLFCAVELVKDRHTKERLGPEVRAAIVKRMASNGVYVFGQGDAFNTMIITPPLTVSKSEIDEGVRALDEALSIADAAAAA